MRLGSTPEVRQDNWGQTNNVATVNYANGVQSAMTYDALNRITGLATQNSGYLYQRKQRK
jgi:hypothetical protein